MRYTLGIINWLQAILLREGGLFPAYARGNSEHAKSKENEVTEKHIEWIKARSECTLKAMMQLLGRQIKEAVEKFKEENSLLSRRNDYDVEVFSRRIHIYKRPNSSVRHKAIILDASEPNIIYVHDGTGPSENISEDNLFKIQIEWNVSKNRCVLVIDEKKYKPWQVTQKVLSDFLFENLEN